MLLIGDRSANEPLIRSVLRVRGVCVAIALLEMAEIDRRDYSTVHALNTQSHRSIYFHSSYLPSIGPGLLQSPKRRSITDEDFSVHATECRVLICTE